MFISPELSKIRSAKAQGFETAQEIIAKEGKEWALDYFRKASEGSKAIDYWRGFLNCCVGMDAADSHGSRVDLPRDRFLNIIDPDGAY